jgi:MerR family mercuric resistance operon transcriptional regulator
VKIGELAACSGCHPETVRYYERIGLLPSPPRTSGGYRDYAPEDVARLRFVSRGRDLGFSLEEIRSLLGLADDDGLSCQEVDRLARVHLADIHTRLDDLQRMATELQRVIDSCSGGERGQCTILDTLRRPPA